MQNVTILGVTLQDRTLSETMAMAERYLTNGALDIVAYVDSDVITYASKNEDVNSFLTKAGMTLWEDKKILELVGIKDPYRSKEVENRAFIKSMLKLLAREKKTIAVAASDQSSLEELKSELLEFEPELGIVHETLIESLQEELPETEINGINEHSPSVVIARADYALQYQWLNSAHMMVNAGIWLALPPGMVINSGEEEKGIMRLWHKLSFKIFSKKAEKAMEG